MYDETARLKVQQLKNSGSFTVLAIETSCDETAAAIVRDGRDVLSNEIYTQIPLHKKYGGVVPEIASRNHVVKLGEVVKCALETAKIGLSGIDAIAVTSGPGLVGALLTGVSYAKGLALALGLPIVGVNHIAGHIAGNYLTDRSLTPPFVCLIASGGHSHIIRVDGYDKYTLLGRTRDDAAGEAFDKIARVLELPYPGGPHLEKLAKEGDPHALPMPKGFNASKDTLDFSFSGLKTAAINAIHTAKQRGEKLNAADVAASFQREVVEVLTNRTLQAAKASGLNRVCIAGGVSANDALYASLNKACSDANILCTRPEMQFCTDNAAMIGCAGYYDIMQGKCDSLTLNANARSALAMQ